MRHLLFILISFLLLSSPVIGDNHTLPVNGGNGETLYLWRWEKIFGIKVWRIKEVWKEFGNEDTEPKYQGHVKDGKPNGMGVLTFTDGRKYMGRWKNGMMNGKGTETSTDGRKFEGRYKDGKLMNGTETSTDGNILYKIVNGEWIEP